ncbi:MAG TPA: hypothetical protein VJ850_08910 [Candidatus Limnocylindrales bacterium]|nr:hypothetical protein [Candidatus Limnocylindrales bacterium]
MRRSRSILAAVALLSAVAGCSLTGGTLGGRDKCWPADPPRAASVWRGILTMDENGFRLVTPDGEPIWLLAGSVKFNWTQGAAPGQLVDASGKVLATAGQDIDLFGGAGSDGGLVVCAVEAVHS